MKKKRALAASRNPSQQDEYTIRGEEKENAIVFHGGNMLDENSEMLKITKDGFWVRGIRVPQDDKEAKIVYDAFQEWMVWSAITRKY